ncbi:heterokaryon incompatibility protein-domain-containing protein [Boeremia exigua]|uniref:heterokaryon incompatibility protein-domain-containing protein n=1 Tax=Boeremia exigua TaxID=749465 RepID=UPI001E8CFCA7|nr:heterokaryon incompatibility protein-domain-containing protein [Boeremia exigua]KAH6625135.1 heterokaryon incompatibility protein-domain-containing protein [Boeremia exigua]
MSAVPHTRTSSSPIKSTTYASRVGSYFRYLSNIVRFTFSERVTDATLCYGCQKLKRRLLRPEIYLGKRLLIHKDFEELSKCADSFCDLCKFLRREYLFQPEFLFNQHPYHRYRVSEKPIFVYNDAGWHANADHDLNQRLFEFRKHFYSTTTEASFHDHETLRNAQPGTSLSLEHCRRWLAICSDTHKICGPLSEAGSKFLPTRLVYVGQKRKDTLRLVITADLANTTIDNYATLSYCWGQANVAACTTKANFDERLHGIPIASLPETILNAIEITRALRVGYIWIDALCIIQDPDGADWQREVHNMGSIYKQSLFTIAASSARDSSTGLFGRKDWALLPAQEYCLEDTKSHNRGYLQPSRPQWHMDTEPLARRGWAMQERLLASRTLFWSSKGVFWECNQMRESEFSSFEREPLHTRYTGSPELPSLRSLAWAILFPKLQVTRWIHLVVLFCKLELTVPSDKLPAISGLGSELARMNGQEFTLGVWTKNLVVELAWASNHSDTSIMAHAMSVGRSAVRFTNAPSWSWASVSARPRFVVEWLHEAGSKIEKPTILTKIQDAQLHLRGRLGSLDLVSLDTTRSTHPSRSFIFTPKRAPKDRRSQDYVLEHATFDTHVDKLPGEGGTVRCLEWMSWTGYRGQPYWAYGNLTDTIDTTIRWILRVTGAIILAPVDGQQHTFRRIGWLEVLDTDFFDAEPQEIILV